MQIDCFPQEVIVWFGIVEASQGVTLNFRPVSTDEAIKRVANHHELEVAPEYELSVEIVPIQEGLLKLNTFQSFVVYFISGHQQLR